MLVLNIQVFRKTNLPMRQDCIKCMHRMYQSTIHTCHAINQRTFYRYTEIRLLTIREYDWTSNMRNCIQLQLTFVCTQKKNSIIPLSQEPTGGLLRYISHKCEVFFCSGNTSMVRITYVSMTITQLTIAPLLHVREYYSCQAQSGWG